MLARKLIIAANKPGRSEKAPRSKVKEREGKIRELKVENVDVLRSLNRTKIPAEQHKARYILTGIIDPLFTQIKPPTHHPSAPLILKSVLRSS